MTLQVVEVLHRSEEVSGRVEDHTRGRELRGGDWSKSSIDALTTLPVAAIDAHNGPQSPPRQ